MSESFGGNKLPDTFDPTSPQQKLKDLEGVLESLRGDAHDEVPPAQRGAAIEMTEKRIKELKNEYPELNESGN